MNKIEITGKVKTQPHLSFFSETPQLFLCRFIVTDHDKNLFPVLCFNKKAKEVTDIITVSDTVKIQGTLQDFIYNDCNLAIHKIKILIAFSIKHIKEDMDKDYIKMEELIYLYNQVISKRYELLDFNERQLLMG